MGCVVYGLFSVLIVLCVGCLMFGLCPVYVVWCVFVRFADCVVCGLCNCQCLIFVLSFGCLSCASPS